MLVAVRTAEERENSIIPFHGRYLTASGLVNHYDSNTSCNAFDYFVVEGLWRYVRSTDEIFCQLAAELPLIPKRLSRTIKT
ncbi:MAG: hypothetical protein ACLRSW_03600 [Christensenellaceae bacterium]